MPQHTIARLARTIYNEPYVAAPMTSFVEQTPTSLSVHHRLKIDGQEQSIHLAAAKPTVLPASESSEHFFKEHEWGFGTARNGRLIRYRVEHPVWEIYPVSKLTLHWDWERAYGRDWQFLADAQTVSTLLAAGSAVRVFPIG